MRDHGTGLGAGLVSFVGLHTATLPVWLLDRVADLGVRLAGARPSPVEEPQASPGVEA